MCHAASLRHVLAMAETCGGTQSGASILDAAASLSAAVILEDFQTIGEFIDCPFQSIESTFLLMHLMQTFKILITAVAYCSQCEICKKLNKQRLLFFKCQMKEPALTSHICLDPDWVQRALRSVHPSALMHTSHCWWILGQNKSVNYQPQRPAVDDGVYLVLL